MKIIETAIHGSYVIESESFVDERGDLREWFREEELIKYGLELNPTQANISKSKRGVIRGIHYSVNSKDQNKYVTCLNGMILDYLIDLRQRSSTFLKKQKIELDYEKKQSIFIPHGVGHAFQSLVDNSIVLYALSSTFSPDKEHSINPLDPELAFEWPISDVILSKKDVESRNFAEMLKLGLLPK